MHVIWKCDYTIIYFYFYTIIVPSDDHDLTCGVRVFVITTDAT